LGPVTQMLQRLANAQLALYESGIFKISD